MSDKEISIIKSRGFGKRKYRLFESGMFVDGPIYLFDSKGNLTLNPRYKGSVMVYENHSLDIMEQVFKQLSMNKL